MCGTKCSGISYDDNDNAGRNTPLASEKISHAPHQPDRASDFSSNYGSLMWEIRNLPRRWGCKRRSQRTAIGEQV